MPAPSTAAALLLGILACLWLPVPPPLWALALGGALAVRLLALSAPSHARARAGVRMSGRLPSRMSGLVHAPSPRLRRLAGIAALGFLLAAVHALHALALRLPVSLQHSVQTLRGTVLELPQHDARRTRFVLEVDSDADMPQALRGRRVVLAWYDEFARAAPVAQAPGAAVAAVHNAESPRLRLRAGSRWQLRAKLRAPRGLRNPGGIDGEKHALMQRIAAVGYLRDADAARELAPPRGADAWRERMSARIAQAVPGPSSRFIRALALGDTRGLDDADWELLRATGLTHLIAISGFHVGLVAAAFALLARVLWWLRPRLGLRLPRPQACALAALFGAVLYAIAAGFALPTLRTVLMVAAVAWAVCARRGWRPVDALALATLALLLFDPLAVLGAGFWLSYAGVAWLLWCLPHTVPQTSGRWWRDFLSAQGVATVGLLPFTVALFGQASLLGPLVNLLAIPWWSLVVVPLTLLGTALDMLWAGAGGWAWRLAAAVFDPSWTLFAWLGASEAALWWLPEASAPALPLALLGALWLLLPRGVPGRGLALLLWLPLLWPDRQLPAHGSAELVVIDVGQGLAVAVRTARHTLLFDTGPAVPEGFDAGERAVVPALRALGAARLDALVLSHADNDHAGGAESVLRALPVARTLAPEDSGLAARVPALRHCRAGHAWRWDGVEFRFLHPTAYFPYLRNESSCVLRVQTREGVFLLTGDIGEVVERMLLRRAPASVRADVVLVAHHGSGSSSDPAFIAATRARLALISAGDGNRFRHPRPEVVQRWRRAGAEVAGTAEGGALRVRLDRHGQAQLRAERRLRPRLWDAAALRGEPQPPQPGRFGEAGSTAAGLAAAVGYPTGPHR